MTERPNDRGMRTGGFAIRGVRVPGFLYGTAWKEDATESLTFGALTTGFRGIDTANQRKHYHEAGVGRAIARALATGIRRDELFVQTKFTHLGGQDHRLPYDDAAPVGEQVAQSFASSLAGLGVDRIDSLLLHGPSQPDGLAPADLEAWRAIELLAEAGHVALIGISNVTAGQLRELLARARIPPAFVQNRCYAERGWDRAIRALCAEHDMVYQAFSLLTANRDVVVHRDVRAIAARHGKTPAQIIFRFAQKVGMLPLTGTQSPEHMRQDLAIDDFELDAQELAIVDAAGER
ncbi:MAG TPA: aldo/keto reductase [Kofleriaceae bacterium]|nr:aldo/keto reductase [Kofleriaceae bacterium]